MKAYSSMSSEEFIFQLREAAIKSKAAPLIIDQIDRLKGDEENRRIEELEQEVETLEETVRALEDQLSE